MINRVVKQYADKWQLDNNIKVEWVDGKVNGADGNTLATSYLGKNKRGDIHPNITIQISKQAENPYAVLRSELEHARDIAKREVPNQKEKHFSRYEGINESEMSLGYVKKKADTRAGKTKTEQKIQEDNVKYNYDIETKNDPDLVTTKGKSEFTSVTIRTKDDKPLGHIRFHDMDNNTLFVDMMENYQGGGGFVRTAIAKVLKENPDKKVYWQAISKESVSSYNKFLDEYPDLANRVKFEDRTSIDDVLDDLYNSEKGFTNETEVHSSQQYNGSKEDLSGTNLKTNRRNDGKNQTGTSSNWSDGLESISNSGSEIKSDTPISNNSIKQQSGTRRTTQQPISERIKETNGDLNQVDGLLDETISKDVELSGTTWKDLAEDAETFYRKVKGLCGDNLLAFKKAFANNDIDLVNLMTRKVLAAERMVSDLAQEANTLIKQGKDVTDIMETIHYLSEYASQIGSAYGRGLNEQKFARKARDFFSLTTLEKQGLNSLVDLLYTDLTSLNFTQTTKQLKEEMYNKIQKYMGGKLWENLTKEPAFGKAFDKYLTKLIADKNITPEAIDKALKSLVTDTQKEELQKFIQLEFNSK